jgi:hypothetical protein
MTRRFWQIFLFVVAIGLVAITHAGALFSAGVR